MRMEILVLTILIGSFGLVFQANASQLVVVASNTEQFPQGAIIEASQEITVPTGVNITLISSDGSTIKLNGPYRGKPRVGSSAPNKSLIKILSEIVTREDASELAGSRGSVPLPDIWAININSSGTYCIPASESTVLWSDQIRLDSNLKIAPLKSPSNTVSLDWPGGAHIVDWPDGLPLRDGAGYIVQFAQRGEEQQITVRIVPVDLVTDVHRAAWMWGNGCKEQAARIVRRLARVN